MFIGFDLETEREKIKICTNFDAMLLEDGLEYLEDLSDTNTLEILKDWYSVDENNPVKAKREIAYYFSQLWERRNKSKRK